MILCHAAKTSGTFCAIQDYGLFAALFAMLRKAQAMPNARGRPLPAAAEKRLGTAGPRAWAEFCLGYCKRLGLLLAIPATTIGCRPQAL